jgi:hypothetical protein
MLSSSLPTTVACMAFLRVCYIHGKTHATDHSDVTKQPHKTTCVSLHLNATKHAAVTAMQDE